MTDRFRWHPEARLFDGAGHQVAPSGQGSPIASDTAQGLANVIGHSAFRIGLPDAPVPEPGPMPLLETLTSGSTGAARRIRRTQASWIASFVVNARMGIGPGAKVAVLGRLVQSLALYGAIEGLHLGAEVHLLSDLRPDRQARALAERRISHLYASPAQLRLLTEAAVPCPEMRLVFVGGSKLDAKLRRSLAAMAPTAEIREFYGAAETSFITIANATTPETSVGRAYEGVQISLDSSGEVWVKSPYVFMGYAAADGGAKWRDGWLSVGEIGKEEGGFLFLSGRAGRMVTVADHNVFPEEIEALMEGLRGVRRAAVLPVRDERRGVVLIAMVQGDHAAEPAILAELRARLGPLKAPKALFWQVDWPLLASGKTDLLALEARVRWPM